MRINSVVVVIVLQFMVSVAANAVDVPKGYRDLAWGASPGRHLKKEPAPYEDITLYRPHPGTPVPPLYGVPVDGEAYYFTKNRFFSASIWVDGREAYMKIMATLMKTYGRPAVIDGHKNLNVWTWPDSPVEVRLAYNDKFGRTTVTYINTRTDAVR